MKNKKSKIVVEDVRTKLMFIKNENTKNTYAIVNNTNMNSRLFFNDVLESHSFDDKYCADFPIGEVQKETKFYKDFDEFLHMERQYNVVVKFENLVDDEKVIYKILKEIPIKDYSNGSIVWMKECEPWLDYCHVPYFKLLELMEYVNKTDHIIEVRFDKL